MKKLTAFFLSLLYFILPGTASAHEAYVLTKNEFSRGLAITSPNPLTPLFDPTHLQLFIFLFVIVSISYGLVILWSASKISGKLDIWIKKAALVGPLIIRLAVSSSFLYAAWSNSILSPELSLAGIPGGEIIRYLLFALGLMILLGVFTEIAALVSLIIFLYICQFFGIYLITYANYFGELLVLLLFGSRFLSIDRLSFGKKLWIRSLEKYKNLEIPIVRILYGIALLYAGWTIKFVHQSLSVAVYNEYHLQNFFHWTASFVAAGAGLSELTLGFFILIGFAMRWTIFLSLIFITLSLLYFHELIWPHLMLYGISFSLLINSGDKFTIDHYLVPFFRKLLFGKHSN